MATQTTNYHLEKPEATDPFGDFRQSYNSNMDIIDANLGGGGGSGGHTILDPDGNSLPQEDDLQFTGAVSVSDDNVNGRTVVNVEACVEVTQAEYDALPASKLTDDIAYFIPDGESDEYKDKADKTDLASIQITGSTNNTGSTITSGTYFYLNDTLVRAKADIANGSTLTLNTNYEVVTAGALNEFTPKSLSINYASQAQYMSGVLRGVKNGAVGNLEFALSENSLSTSGTVVGVISGVGLPSTPRSIMVWTVENNIWQICQGNVYPNGNIIIYPATNKGITSILGTYEYLI